MRASASALLTFAAVAAANPSNGPPNEDITLKVGAGSSLEGYQLVGFIDNGAGFPAFVTAAEAAESSSTFHLFYEDYGHFGWYSLNIDIDGATYGLDVEAPGGTYEGPMIFIDSATYGTNIWDAKNDSPAFTWVGDSRDSTFACTNDDGHIQLGIYTPGKEPSNCEQVQLEYKAVA
ncbi:hypothetical protein F5Y19DRAFT_427331 [Xylariaceae sp. FL1651]|nr:hypothetical protein F5Y19DRAFT_427331 [Xylariaceae sp. FL1651]